MHALTENIREEVDIEYFSLINHSGAVETELVSHTTDEEIKAGYEDWKQLMGAVIEPETIAKAAMFAW